MMMIPRRRNEFDLFNDFFGGDDFFTRREQTLMKTDIREKEAVITKAAGEVEASNNLAQAARTMSAAPGALHLRTLATLNDLSSDQSNTVIFAIPIEGLEALKGIAEKGKKDKE